MSEIALIIEDDEDLANIFATALRGVGFEVEHIADGKKAQERLLGGDPPYLVLLDMHLPYISGGELLTNILKKDEPFRKNNGHHHNRRRPHGGSLWRPCGFCHDQTDLIRAAERPDCKVETHNAKKSPGISESRVLFFHSNPRNTASRRTPPHPAFRP